MAVRAALGTRNETERCGGSRAPLVGLDTGANGRPAASVPPLVVPAGENSIPLTRRLELVRQLPGFEADDEGSRLLAAGLEERRLAPGDVLFAQGDAGDELFLVAEGTAELTTEGRWGPVSLRTLRPGDMVGELALVIRQPRNATLTATTDVRLLALSRAVFDGLLADDERRREAFERYAENIVVAGFIREVGPFAALTNDQHRWLATRVKKHTVPAGTSIVTAGDVGAACYMVMTGSAEVLVADGPAPPRRIAEVARGNLIGEGSLLTGGLRAATVRALEPCVVLEVAGDDLLRIAADAPDFAREVTYLFRLRARPARRDAVIAGELTNAEGETLTTLKNPELLTYFRLSPRGRAIWDRLDGTRTLRDITLEISSEVGLVPPQAVAELVVGLARAGMLRDASVAASPAAGVATVTGFRRVTAAARRSMCFMHEVRGVDRWLTTMFRRGGWVLGTRPAQLVAAAIALSGVVCFVLRLSEGSTGLQRHPGLLAFVAPGMVLSVLVHELCHGLAVKAHGRSVLSAGIGLFWMRPAVFVDTSESWFGDRRERIVVSLAGPYSGLVLGGALTTGALIAGNGSLGTVLWSMALPIVFMVVMNLAPFIELDGYHVLSDLLDRPRLRESALEEIAAWRRGDTTSRGDLRLSVSYAAASLVYLLALLVSMIVVLRLVLEPWLKGFFAGSVAVPLAWALTLGQVALVLGAIVEDYATIWPTQRTRAGR